MVLIANDDQPGVIGDVGTIFGRHGVNIASFGLGRGESGAIGVVNIDEDSNAIAVLDAAVDELQRVPAIREVHVIRLT
jgi:D-3-phosphoglycerate dehydrogenase